MLSLSLWSLEFDQGVDASRFVIQNTGGGTLQWSLKSNDFWLYASPPGGALGPGESSVVSVTVNRARLKPGGTYAGGLFISSNAGSAAVQVTVFN